MVSFQSTKELIATKTYTLERSLSGSVGLLGALGGGYIEIASAIALSQNSQDLLLHDACRILYMLRMGILLFFFRRAFQVYIVPFLLTGAIVSNLVESFEVDVVDG